MARIFKEYLYPTEEQWEIQEINDKKEALQVYTKSKKLCYIILAHILDGFF